MRFGVTTAACWARAANPLPDRTGRRFITSHADSFVNEWMIGLLGEAPILAISAELPTGRQCPCVFLSLDQCAGRLSAVRGGRIACVCLSGGRGDYVTLTNHAAMASPCPRLPPP
jgi:hypothetical protein